MSPPKTTIWLWPTGLFPRRVLYYLRVKQITLSALHAHNIHLIPVVLNPSASKLQSREGYEERPEGMSLPCMRIEHREGGERVEYVRESLAIVGFLEEVFRGEGCGNIMGNTPSQRAHTTDIISLLSDATIWSSTALIHSDPNTLSWSGLSASNMSASAAADAQKRFHRLLSKLEEWVEKDIVKGGSQSLSGEGGGVTLADIVLMSSVSYAEDHYGKDWVEEHGVLRIWCERAKGCEWYVRAERLRECEERGWDAVLAK
jgi:glutathione S-transferase